jgi:hypothetical protein
MAEDTTKPIAATSFLLAARHCSFYVTTNTRHIEKLEYHYRDPAPASNQALRPAMVESLAMNNG